MVRNFLWFLSAILLLAGIDGASAGERRLLSAGSFGQSLTSQPAAALAFGQLRSKAAAAGKVRVIVGLRVPFAAEGQLAAPEARRQRNEIAAARTAILSATPDATAGNVRSFNSLPFVAMDVTPEELARLAADRDVLSLTEDRLNKPQLAQSVPLISGDAAWAAGYRGLGQTIAILDTGVDKMHPFLFGKVVSEACYSRGGWCPGGQTSSIAPGSARPCPAAVCSHGTHVAGIAAGVGWNFSGVAKDASLIAIQVFSPGGVAYDSDIIAGLERVYELRTTFRIAAVNMSLGGGSYTGTCDGDSPGMTTIIKMLRQAGIATVISSGNDYATASISFPACISEAVSVGSVSDSAWGNCAGQPAAVDKVACYSNSASFLSLLAPGSLITSSVPNRRYAAFHGTSMAAPHVAGAWAVLKEKSPSASVTEILAALQSTGKPVADYRNGISKPRINVLAALGVLLDDRKALSYVRGGTAPGTVTFTPAGTVATCQRDCINRFATGTDVALTATPDPGARFYGWGGACSGTGTCSVTMWDASTVYAGFYKGTLLPLNLTKAGAGGGSVAFSTSGFTANCGGSCSQSYWKNASVWLTAVPDQGSYFKGWGGACRGQKANCVVRLSRAKSVTASFEKLPAYAFTYTQTGSGGGSLNLGSARIPPCTGSCSLMITAGTQLMLAVANVSSEFKGWSGTCQGSKTSCLVTVNGPVSLSGEFSLLPATTAAR